MGMWAAIGTAALATVAGVISSENERANANAQADALEAQALTTRRQAELQAQKGELEARNIDRQKAKLRREFEAQQGHNRSLLAAGNIDMSSGSAADVAEGNILHFGQEMGENAYDVALKRWETNEQVKAMNYQADVYDAQASYISSSAGSFGTSLLKGALQGAITFGSMYGASALGAGGAGATAGSTAAQPKVSATAGVTRVG